MFSPSTISPFVDYIEVRYHSCQIQMFILFVVIFFSSRDQKASKTLDILTGFQIIDGVRHIFVLEGLRDEGINEIVGKLLLDETKGM